jgi:hypothetical protein
MRRSPFNGRLLLWGRAPDGWHGLVGFALNVTLRSEPARLAVAAWLPSRLLSAGAGASSTPEIARITLPSPPADWPSPAPPWSGYFAGRWTSGELPLPDGAQLLTGPAWRRRGAP